jgi:GSH-dependent disulfide-bond oxidoreductase
MIEVWTWPTPNGHKVHIALEELGIPYTIVPVAIGKGEQFRPEFLAITPNHRIPAIVDPDGPGGKRFTLFESGAILIYLAEKAGRLIPRDPAARYICLQWVMFQMGGVGPMFGQRHHFARFAKDKIPYAIDRFTKETHRLYAVLDRRLGEVEYLAGEYSIADVATYPWVARWEWHDIAWSDYPNVDRWFRAITARPAVDRGMKVP